MDTDLLQVKIDKARSLLSEETRKAVDNTPWKAEILKLRETKGYSFGQLEDLEIETELLLCGLLDSKDYPKELETRMRLTKDQLNDLLEYMNKSVFQRIRQEIVKILESKKREEDKKTSIETRSEALNGLISQTKKPITWSNAGETKNLQNPEQKNELEIRPEELQKGEGGDTPLRENIEARDEILATLENPEKIPVSPVIQMTKAKNETPKEKILPEKEQAPAQPVTKIENLITPQKTEPKSSITDKKLPTPDFVPSKKLFSSFQSQETKTEHSINNSEQGSVPAPLKTGGGESSPKPKIDPYREIPE